MRERVTPSGVHGPVSDYSMGLRVPSGALLFIAGQIPLDEAGRLVGKGDARAQTRQVFENLRRTVEAAGGTLEDLATLTVYVTARAHLPAFREVRREFLREPYPAATGVIVRGLADEDWLVEIDAIAALRAGAEGKSEG